MNDCKNIPDGFSDLLFEETLPLQEAEQKLSALFVNRGFRAVRTSMLEYYDVYSRGASRVPQENMYKLTDTAGRLAVLRPDNTTPIARLCATRLKSQPLPLKICYNQSVYRITDSYKGHRCEKRQSGVELLGSSSRESDLACLATALEALDTLYGGDVQTVLELGHVGFSGALVDALSLPGEEKDAVRRSLSRGIPSPFDSAASFKEAEGLFSSLPRLFGGREVFQKAEALAAGNANALAALSELSDLFEALAEAGYEDRICVDLGVRQEIEYYTGLVFRAYALGAGESILSGGRYDTLLCAFGENIPAIGFAVELDTAAKLLAPRKALSYDAPDALIHYETGLLGEALKQAKRFQSYELSTFNNFDAACKYAQERGIKTLLNVTNGKTEEVAL